MRDAKTMTKRSMLAGSAAALAVLAMTACGPAAEAGDSNNAKNAAANGASSGHKNENLANAGNTSKASSSRCQSSDLSVTSKPVAGGGMGHATSRLTFTNVSGGTCWVYGYPGVSFVAGDDGHQVGGAATRDSHHGPGSSAIWLSPDEHAYATLDQANPLNYPEKTCDPTYVRGLRVYPPDETAAKYVPDPGHACANDSIGRPTISALTQSS